MPKGSLKNRKILSSSSANRNTLKAEKEKEKISKEDISRGDQGSSDIHKLLKAQTEKNQRKSWNRLDRGIRIQKVRSWVRVKEEWPDTIIEKAEALLVKRIKTGGLSSSSSVIYDKKSCEILKIPCLKLVYAIDASGNDTTNPIDVLIQTNAGKAKRSKA
jgi:hypothetical protein